MKYQVIKSVLNEYGIRWVFYRSLYSAKLKLMATVPGFERVFEKQVNVRRVDIFDIDVVSIKNFLTALPGDKQEAIITAADKAVNGIITGFSSIELDYGNPINWHYSPVSKEESSRSKKWYTLPDFDDRLGDVKVVWEASRFTHFLSFSRAYLITGDTKYYKAFSEQLEQWLKNNPYSFGANYKCGQECTLRMINALIAYAVFKPLCTPGDEENIYGLVEVCYRKVISNFFYAKRCIRNNHTLSEICGLIIGSWCCLDLDGLKKAYRLLDREIDYQFTDDGGYIQFSFNYQRLAMQILECVCKISSRTNMSISEKSKERIRNSALLMYQVQDATGDVPNYGYNDGAHIFNVTTGGYRDFRPVINTAYALTEGRSLFPPGDHDEELLWFGNDAVPQSCHIERKTAPFKGAGLYTFRHNNGFLMICLRNFRSRPAQMDQLHIDLWHNGKNVFCDSGTYSYANDIGKSLVLTQAHNTAQPDNVEQMNKHGAFLIYDWTECKNVEYHDTYFSGTMISKNGYEHTRTIEQVEYGYKISDEIRGDGEYCNFYLHTPCMVEIISEGFKITDENGILCTVIVPDGDIKSDKVYRSLYYLKKEEITRITIRKPMTDRKCLATFQIMLN
ncbi:MAG: heparinase II/III family protein [Syntrophomonas sp.]